MTETPTTGRKRLSPAERQRVEAERKLRARARGRRLADLVCLVGILGVLLGFSLPWLPLGTVYAVPYPGSPAEATSAPSPSSSSLPYDEPPFVTPAPADSSLSYEARHVLGWELALFPWGVRLRAGMPATVHNYFSDRLRPFILIPALGLLFALLIALDRRAGFGRGVSVFYVLFSLAALSYVFIEIAGRFVGLPGGNLAPFNGPGCIVTFLALMALFLGALMRWPNSARALTAQFAALRAGTPIEQILGPGAPAAPVTAAPAETPVAPAPAEPAEPEPEKTEQT